MDLMTTFSYEECLEAMKNAEDDAKRATIMNQAIIQLKSQISKLKVQIGDLKK